MSIIALSRLQRAVYTTETPLPLASVTSNYDRSTFDDDAIGGTGGKVGIDLLKRVFQRNKFTMKGITNDNYSYRNDNSLEIEQNLLADLAHYSIFANVAYGWKMGILGGRLHIGDLKTLLSRTGIEETHVIDTNWKSKTHLPAYFLVRDVKKKKIVLCIRGTLSAKDILTDLCCEAEDFMSYEEEEEKSLTNKSEIKFRARAHQGMVNSARGVATMTHDLIKSELDENPDYDLVLVGHSLGGGVASILGTIWKETFPGLTVYAYGCPCVAPLNVYPTIDESVISVVGEGDPFSCLSLGHLADASIALSNLCEDDELRDEIFNRTKEILNVDEVISYGNDKDGNTSDYYEEDIKWCKDILESLSDHSSLITNGGDKRTKTEKFYPPGRVLHMKGNLFGTNVDQVTLTEVQSEDIFRHLKLHPRMFDLSLHIPHRYETLLSRIWSRVNLN